MWGPGMVGLGRVRGPDVGVRGVGSGGVPPGFHMITPTGSGGGEGFRRRRVLSFAILAFSLALGSSVAVEGDRAVLSGIMQIETLAVCSFVNLWYIKVIQNLQFVSIATSLDSYTR